MKFTFLILGLFLCITFAQDLQQKLDYEEWEPLLSYLEVMKVNFNFNFILFYFYLFYLFYFILFYFIQQIEINK